MTPIRRLGAVTLTLGLTALVGCGSDKLASAPSTTAASSPTPGSTPSTDATAYCTSKGGTPETRQAYFNTNADQAQWVALGQSKTLCRFESNDADKSRIYIDVDSLAAEQPTLAAAAYLAKLPVTSTGGANPAAVDCNQNVLGTSSYGTTVSGGGWVNLADPVFTVVDMCTFADGSAIDEWGITYYSNDVVRGADLAPMFRFDPAVVSQIFPQGSTRALPTTTT